MTNTKINFCGVEFKNPIVTASGTFGFGMEYNEFVSILQTWRTEILNSFKRPLDDRKLSNALSENINGQIRTYLAVSNGVRNFTRFRKRCLLSLNRKVFYSIKDQLKSDKKQNN